MPQILIHPTQPLGELGAARSQAGTQDIDLNR
jgi:hypothetical protein